MAVWSNVTITDAGKRALHGVSMGAGRLQVTGAAAFVDGTKVQNFRSVTLKQDSESEGIYVLRLVLDSAYGLVVLGTTSYKLKDIHIFATYFEKSAESGLEEETQITFAIVSANGSGDEIEVNLSDGSSTLITYTFRLEVEDGVTEFGFTSLDSTEVGIATEAYVDNATKPCLKAVVVDEPPVYSEYISNGIEGFEVLNSNAVVSFDSSTGFVATTKANMGTDVDGGSVALSIPDKFLGVESLTVGFDMVWCGDNHMFLALADSSVHVAPYRAVGTDEHTAQDFDMEKGILSSFGFKRRQYFVDKVVTPTLSAFYSGGEDTEGRKVHVEWKVNKKTNTGTLTLKTLGEGPSQILTDNFTYNSLTPNSIFLYLGFVGAKVIINNLTIAGSGFVDNMVYVVGEGTDKKIYLSKNGKLTSITDPAPTFTESEERGNIESGTFLSVILGKIKKWYTDLKAVAFSGSYDDLSNKPVDATQSVSGFMSSTDKKKLDGIATGAQKNSITGVKGDSEASYRTGKVNITKENIGLGNVDNESKLTMFTSPTFTGTPTTTQNIPKTSNDKTVANTSFVQAAIAAAAFDPSTIPSLHTHSNKSVLDTITSAMLNKIHTHSNKSVLDGISSTDVSNWDSKADGSHSHSISDVANLQNILNDKADNSHNHDISSITDLQTTLDGKADSAHTHGDYEYSIEQILTRLVAVENKVDILSDWASLSITVTHINDPETLHGRLSASATGVWSDGTVVDFTSTPEDEEYGNVSMYLVFSIDTDKSVSVSLVTSDGAPLNPDPSWGVNYISIEDNTATYSTKIYTR